MEDTGHILVAIVVSLGGIVGLIFIVMLCSWCYQKRDDDDDSDLEEVVSSKYRQVSSGQDEVDGADVRQLSKRSWEDKAPEARRSFKNSPPALTSKTIQFERPEKRVVAEHVQPSSNTQTSLNQSLGVRRDVYQATGTTRVPSTPTTPTLPGSTVEVPMATAAESRGMWQGVRNLATKLMEDVTEGAEPPAPVEQVEGLDYKLGKIQFNLCYDFQNLTLTLKIHKATGLPAKDFSGTSDPYVKILLLPDKKHKLLTKVKKKNLNPHWNECFLFEGWPHNKLLEKTLYLQIIDYDRFSRDDPIGEIYIPLNEVDLSLSPTVWKFLQPCKDSRGKLGEILISLCYQPSVGRLTIVVMKAKDLKAKDITGTSDPYVKLWLMYGNNKVEKKKTTMKKRTLNPVFNETFIFEIPWEKIREAALEVTVMDFDKVGRNELIGKFVLGSRSGPVETRHWNDMIAKPRQQIAQWHLLKD